MANPSSVPHRPISQPIDRWVVLISLLCTLILGILLIARYVTPPQVREFNWQQQRVAAQDRRLVLRFNRLMDADSIAQHLRIDPPLTGIGRTIGQRWIFSLSQPAQYGQAYRLFLDQAEDAQGDPMTTPFVGEFRTPDRQILTVGLEGEERGRLVLVNLEIGSRTPLTPAGLRVTQFEPQGSQVYLFATDSTPQAQDLYRLDLNNQTFERLLEHEGYQNLRLHVVPTGSLAVVERFRVGGGVEIWVSRNRRFQPLALDNLFAGDFIITPDETSLLMAQGQGISVVPLAPNVPTETFLAQYGQALSIRSDGTQAAMVQFNPDFSRSIWVVSHLGNEVEVISVEGSVLSGAFSTADTVLYLLATDLDPDTLNESPVLLALNWRTGQQIPLVEVPFPAELDFAISPDGRTLVYSIMQPSTGIPQANSPISITGQSIAAAQLWALDVSQMRDWQALGEIPAPQPLGIPGVGVAWIP